MGVTVGAFADEVPASWGVARKSQLTLQAQPVTVARYPYVVLTLSKDEIWMITVLDGYSQHLGDHNHRQGVSQMLNHIHLAQIPDCTK